MQENTEKPENKPSKKPSRKRGPKPENGKNRVRLGGSGPYVSEDTQNILNGWKKIFGVAPGRALDQCVLACANNPTFSLKK